MEQVYHYLGIGIIIPLCFIGGLILGRCLLGGWRYYKERVESLEKLNEKIAKPKEADNG